MAVNYIKPTEMKNQIKMSNQALREENSAYLKIQTISQNISKDQALKGKSWRALKKVYRNYKRTASLMIQANNAMIKANNLVATRIGSEELIRPQIMTKIHELEETIRREEDFLARTSGSSHRCSYLAGRRAQARQTIWHCRNAINILQGKIKRMDEIERNTRSVYSDASSLYKRAEKQMKKVIDAWNGTAAPALIARQLLDSSVASIKMEDMQEDRSDRVWEIHHEEEDVIIDYDLSELDIEVADILRDWQLVTDDRMIAYDVSKIEMVLEKEANAITEPEYEALAYIMISVESMAILDDVLGWCQVINQEFIDLRESLQVCATEKLTHVLHKVDEFKEGKHAKKKIIMREGNKNHIDDILTGKVVLKRPETKMESIGVQFVRN